MKTTLHHNPERSVHHGHHLAHLLAAYFSARTLLANSGFILFAVFHLCQQRYLNLAYAFFNLCIRYVRKSFEATENS